MAINPANLLIDPKCIGSAPILVGVDKWYEYVNKVKQDEPIGYRYTVACPKLGMEKISVRIKGDKVVELDDDFCTVKFEGLTLVPYVIDSELKISATATGISIGGKIPLNSK